MPTLIYKNKPTKVENTETSELDDVESIPANRLFVSEEVNKSGRYAFDIKELEDYYTAHNSLINYYTKQQFTKADMLEITNMSEPLKQKLQQTQTAASDQLIKLISGQTIYEMRKFIDRSADFIKDQSFLDDVKNNYKQAELAQFEASNISVMDLARGKAFDDFKKYYAHLTESEKNAIDNYPGMQESLRLYNLGRNVGDKLVLSLNNIFYLPAGSCLGGTAGILQELVQKIEFAKRSQPGQSPYREQYIQREKRQERSLFNTGKPELVEQGYKSTGGPTSNTAQPRAETEDSRNIQELNKQFDDLKNIITKSLTDRRFLFFGKIDPEKKYKGLFDQLNIIKKKIGSNDLFSIKTSDVLKHEIVGAINQEKLQKKYKDLGEKPGIIKKITDGFNKYYAERKLKKATKAVDKILPTPK